MHTEKIGIEVDEAKDAGKLIYDGCVIGVEGFVVEEFIYF
jgi:hypothetical protein